ncbi:unnamed protein product [marine sediment metagenome]|uniref:Uncharacterized protein n=1 Tax=marine sediment metagenome TaxID=412755 RepID=X1UP73_9ZZZZ
MLIERTNNEIIIRISAMVDTDDLQDFINYVRYKELTFDINVPQDKINELASDLNKNWWKKNRKRFIK